MQKDHLLGAGVNIVLTMEEFNSMERNMDGVPLYNRRDQRCPGYDKLISSPSTTGATMTFSMHMSEMHIMTACPKQAILINLTPSSSQHFNRISAEHCSIVATAAFSTNWRVRQHGFWHRRRSSMSISMLSVQLTATSLNGSSIPTLGALAMLGHTTRLST